MKVGLGGLLFVLFLALKLTHQIAWSWLWVTAPLWAGLALWVLITSVITFVAVIAAVAASRR